MCKHFIGIENINHPFPNLDESLFALCPGLLFTHEMTKHVCMCMGLLFLNLMLFFVQRREERIQKPCYVSRFFSGPST